MFLNISNHPSVGWSAAQRAAAQDLAGSIADEPFPDVPPEATPDQVRELAQRLLDRVSTLHPSAAMVQGEFTLAFFLVRELQSRGIPCYAATTRRVEQATRLPDGSTQRISRFEFVRFRRYL